MENLLHPKALKAARNNKNWTQEQLSNESKCSVAQISRWECADEPQKLRTKSIERITKALGVEWRELTKAPESPGNDGTKLYQPVQLNVRVSPSVRNALILASRRYHVRPADIIELAPLLFLITAEQSLAARRIKANEIDEQYEQALENGRETLPHLAPAFLPRDEIEEAITRELSSIERREVFNKVDLSDLNLWFDDDGEEADPFVSYLEQLIEDIPSGLVDGLTTGYSRAPDYRIAGEDLREITGIEGHSETDMELLDLITGGAINLAEFIKEKQRLSEPDFENWLNTKIKEVKIEQKTYFDDLLGGEFSFGDKEGEGK